MKRNIGFVLLVGCLIFAAHAFSAKSEANLSFERISIGALVPLSGELASQGEVIQASLEQSVHHVNNDLVAAGYDFLLELHVADSQSDPKVVVERAEELRLRGTNLFIVGSSAEVEALREWSEEHGTIVISFSSTAPSLAIEGDGIFRVIPNDVHQAEALTTLFMWKNISDIVIVHRNDVYGNELAELVAREFIEMDGTVATPVTYEPNTTDFHEVVSQIEERLETLEADRSTTGIVLIAFDEAAHLLAQADSLFDLHWFTSDSLTNNDVLLQSFANGLQLTGVTFGMQDSYDYEKLKAELRPLIGNKDLIPKAVYAYDIPWMVASILERMDNPLNVAELKEKMIELSSFHVGVTGWMLLDETGDRKYAQYDIWQVQRDEASVNWHKTGTYVRAPGLPGYIQEYHGEQNVSRAEYVYVLSQAFEWNGDGEVLPFVDVDHVDADLKRALAQAIQHEVIAGYSDGTFRPDEPITRTEMMVMLVRAMATVDIELTDVAYEDEEAIPAWAREDVAKAAAAGLILLDEDNRFQPNEPVTVNQAIRVTEDALKYADQSSAAHNEQGGE